MKILVLTPYFFPHFGGSEHYIEGLYGELMRQNRKIKVDVLSYSFNGEARVEKYNGFTVYRVPGLELLSDQFALPNYWLLLNLLKKLKKNNYAYVNAHTRFFDTAWWGFLAAKYLGAKAILTDHCAAHPNHPSLLVRFLTKGLDRLVMPFLYRVYPQITVVSQATKRFWQEAVGESRKITVVPNGVDHRLAQKVVKIKRELKKKSVRFFGRGIITKGGAVFDQMVKILKGKYPQVVFERISGVSHEQALRVLKKTDIVVHPSKHHEGLPTLLLEAGLMGCTVVASRAGGTTDLIKHGETGLLVDPEAKKIALAVEKLLHNPVETKSLGKHLQGKVLSNYTWDTIVRTFTSLIS